MRYTASHVMAQAVLRLWPGAKYSIGPAIESGFYYDFQLPAAIGESDLARIEAEMAEGRRRGLPDGARRVAGRGSLATFGNGEGPAGEAGPAGTPVFDIRHSPAAPPAIQGRAHPGPCAAAEAAGEPVPTISVYTQGEFTDLCRGPHLPSTGRLGKGTYKLTSIAGAYWRGDERTRC